MQRLQGFIVGLIITAAAIAWAAPVSFTGSALPVALLTDAKTVVYSQDANGWHVQGHVCPRVDTSMLVDFPAATLPCTSKRVDIAAPSGAFLTQLKADFKLVVQAAGYTSAD